MAQRRVSSPKTKRKPPPSTTTTLAVLRPDPHNRRAHNARNLDMIATALSQVGAARSIVIDEHNEVLAGNGVVQAAPRAGLSKLQIVDVEGDTLVAVRRRGLSAAQKRELALYDNRAAELAEWDVSQLQTDLDAGELLAPFFTQDELAAVFATRAPADAADQVAQATAVPPGVTARYLVIVTCDDETAQTTLLERLLAEGLSCRAVIS